MYIKRTLEKFLKEANKQFPVLLVTGPRQVGKTSLLKHLSKDNRAYVTLDNPVSARLAKEEPELFLEQFKPPVLIDEIQYAPNLFPYIKMYVDEHQNKGDFWLTGSQRFQLMKGVSESLAGRVGIMNLLGLSQAELNNEADRSIPFFPETIRTSKAISSRKLYEKIWKGSFPSVAIDGSMSGDLFSGEDVFQGMDRDFFYSSYLQTYLQRDVKDLTKVGDESAFLKFLYAVAIRTGQELNMSSLSKDVGKTVPTIKNWLSILEASGVIYLLRPYYNRLIRRAIKSPKIYFLDTGLCSYLTEWSTPADLEKGVMNGAMLETYVVAEIIKSYWHNGKREPLYFYRDKDGMEIDLIVQQGSTLYPIEIKKTGSPTKDMVKNFSLLKKKGLDVGKGALICLFDKHMPISVDADIVPVSFI